MRILAVGSHVLPNPNMQSQVDHWRIGRPMRELSKHTDWQIDHAPFFIPSYDKNKQKQEFTPEEMQEAYDNLKVYDIIFSSYHPDPTAYTLLKVLRDRENVKFIMDCDDDMFAINPDNPFWLKIEHEQVYWMQRMVADNDYITTPSPILAERFRERRPELPKESVVTIPNYLPDDYAHPGFDNGDKLVIGYMGGSSHYADLHETGVLEAIQQLMHENKKIRFHSVGMFVDTYLPKKRTTFEVGKRGTQFLDDIFPKLNFDIAIAPLCDNLFNEGKSNIKWQEMTRAGSVIAASKFGPYTTLKDGVNAALVKQNTKEDWYNVLKKLIDKPKLRSILLENAQRELKLNWRLENHWTAYKDLFEQVHYGKIQAKRQEILVAS
jgi:glycosyltransferase involved in cell wall biosynthesis